MSTASTSLIPPFTPIPPSFPLQNYYLFLNIIIAYFYIHVYIDEYIYIHLYEYIYIYIFFSPEMNTHISHPIPSGQSRTYVKESLNGISHNHAWRRQILSNLSPVPVTTEILNGVAHGCNFPVVSKGCSLPTGILGCVISLLTLPWLSLGLRFGGCIEDKSVLHFVKL